jgi:hypothetical protein
LASLLEPEPYYKVESVPQYGTTGIRAGPTPVLPEDFGRQAKHKDVLTSEFVPAGYMLKQQPVRSGLFFDGVQITWTTRDGPNSFWGVFQDDKNKYSVMNNEMETFYNKFHQKYELLPYDQLKEGSFYVVNTIHENDLSQTRRWYRCQIKKTVTSQDPVTAFLVDVGGTVRSSVKTFRRLKHAFSELPIRAYEFALQPAEGKALKTAIGDCKDFNELVLHQEFRVIVYAFPIATGNMKKIPVILVDFRGINRYSVLDDIYVSNKFSKPLLENTRK